MGGRFLGHGTECKSGGLPEEVHYTVYALYGISRPRTDKATWEYLEVLWTG